MGAKTGNSTSCESSLVLNKTEESLPHFPDWQVTILSIKPCKLSIDFLLLLQKEYTIGAYWDYSGLLPPGSEDPFQKYCSLASHSFQSSGALINWGEPFKEQTEKILGHFGIYYSDRAPCSASQLKKRIASFVVSSLKQCVQLSLGAGATSTLCALTQKVLKCFSNMNHGVTLT